MSAKLREMLEKRNRSVTEARALVDKAEAEKREMSAEETGQYDALLKDAVNLRDSIDRETRLQEEERANAAAAAQNAVQKPSTPDAELRSVAFRNLLRTGQLTAEEQRALVTGSDTGGGFLNAPQEFVPRLIAAVKNMTFLEGLTTGFTTTNVNGLGFPTLETDVDDFSMITEIKTAPEDSALAFGKREFKAHPSSKLIKCSDAMLRADGIDPEAIVMDRVAYKYAILKENKYLLGTGNQEPLGLFVASAKGIYLIFTMSLAGTTDFTADDIVNIKYNMKAQYMTKSSWLFNRTAVAKLAKVKDGEGRYLFELTDKIGALDNLKGSPLYMSEYVPNTFTTGLYVGMFADFSWYWTLQSLSLRIKRLNELFAATRQVGFLFDTEFDGMPVLSEAFTRIKCL